MSTISAILPICPGLLLPRLSPSPLQDLCTKYVYEYVISAVFDTGFNAIYEYQI